MRSYIRLFLGGPLADRMYQLWSDLSTFYAEELIGPENGAQRFWEGSPLGRLETRRVAYNRQTVAGHPQGQYMVILADGHEVEPGQVIYCLEGYEPFFFAVTKEYWKIQPEAIVGYCKYQVERRACGKKT